MVIAAPFTPESSVVLVVEDDDKLASLIGRMLDRAGYDCVLAPTGDEALRAMRDRAPDAAIVDVMIPHPDGIEICRKFRRDGWEGPIIAISGRNSTDDRRRTLEAGADTFLAKPFRLADVIAELERFHGQRRDPLVPGIALGGHGLVGAPWADT